MTTTELTLVLSSLGVGSMLGLFAQSALDRRKHQFSKAFEFKEARFKAISILMWVAVKKTDSEYASLRQYRPQIQNEADLDRELELEYYNATIFASDDVLKALKWFLSRKDIESWEAVARAMRKDLYR